MVLRKKEGSLTQDEKRIVKALLAKGVRNQDIQALINIGRKATINSARITGVKQDAQQKAASDEEVEHFKIIKNSFDPKTGLNPYLDERLIKSREAIKLAVSVFNNPSFSFRAENFSMLAVVA